MAKAKKQRRPEIIRVTRFCSRKEYEALMHGETVTNNRDHYNGGRGGSLSVGFCFTEDNPMTAWRYLKGVAVAEVCLVLDIPREMLTRSTGVYRDVSSSLDRPRKCLKEEWCLTSYSLNDIRLIKKYEMYEVASFNDFVLLEYANRVAASNLSPVRSSARV